MSIPTKSTPLAGGHQRRRLDPYKTPQGRWTKFKRHHPHGAAAIRNTAAVAAIVAPLAVLGGKNLRMARDLRMKNGRIMRNVSDYARAETKRYARRGKIQRGSAIVIGGLGGTAGTFVPLERHLYERRQRRRAEARPYVVHVVNRTTGERRQIDMHRRD